MSIKGKRGEKQVVSMPSYFMRMMVIILTFSLNSGISHANVTRGCVEHVLIGVHSSVDGQQAIDEAIKVDIWRKLADVYVGAKIRPMGFPGYAGSANMAVNIGVSNAIAEGGRYRLMATITTILGCGDTNCPPVHHEPAFSDGETLEGAIASVTRSVVRVVRDVLKQEGRSPCVN